MTRTDDTRIYLQLAPTIEGRDALVDLQNTLPVHNGGRMLPPEELHVTVVHFGKIEEVYGNLERSVGTERAVFDAALDDLIAAYENLPTEPEYVLAPVAMMKFGKNAGTLVVRYEAGPELYALHAQALDGLQTFFAACGVADPDAYMGADPNFKNALTLVPHVTLYKGYDGPPPDVPLPDLAVSVMKIVY